MLEKVKIRIAGAIILAAVILLSIGASPTFAGFITGGGGTGG